MDEVGAQSAARPPPAEQIADEDSSLFQQEIEEIEPVPPVSNARIDGAQHPPMEGGE